MIIIFKYNEVLFASSKYLFESWENIWMKQKHFNLLWKVRFQIFTKSLSAVVALSLSSASLLYAFNSAFCLFLLFLHLLYCSIYSKGHIIHVYYLYDKMATYACQLFQGFFFFTNRDYSSLAPLLQPKVCRILEVC